MGDNESGLALPPHLARQRKHTKHHELAKRVEVIEKLIGVNDLPVQNVHFLVHNIRDLRSIVEKHQRQINHMALHDSLVAKFLDEIGIKEKFVEWMKAEIRGMTEKANAENEEKQGDTQ